MLIQDELRLNQGPSFGLAPLGGCITGKRCTYLGQALRFRGGGSFHYRSPLAARTMLQEHGPCADFSRRQKQPFLSYLAFRHTLQNHKLSSAEKSLAAGMFGQLALSLRNIRLLGCTQLYGTSVKGAENGQFGIFSCALPGAEASAHGCPPTENMRCPIKEIFLKLWV